MSKVIQTDQHDGATNAVTLQLSRLWVTQQLSDDRKMRSAGTTALGRILKKVKMSDVSMHKGTRRLLRL